MIGFGGDPGFDVTFSIMQVIMLLVFVLVLGSIIVTLIRGVGEWNKNNQSPKLTVPATVVAKRSDVHRGIETMHTFTSYYVTFQGIYIAMYIVASYPHAGHIRSQLFRHTLGQGSHQDSFVFCRALRDLLHQVIDLV